MVTGASASVEINSTNFPDTLFRYYISVDCDVNPHDGWLSDEEIAAVKEFNKRRFTANNGTIKMYSMKGVEYLTELVSIDCRENPLSSLDLSKNKKLRHVDCRSNEVMTSLNVSGLQELVYLHCAANSLTELDLTGCSNLEELYCSINSLRELDLSGNSKLKVIECWANDLGQLDVSGHTYLVSLDSNMNYLESLSASGCTSLSRIHSPNNLLTSINVAYCPNLRTVNLNGNRFSELDFSGYSELQTLHCGVNLLVSLDVRRCGKLSSLECQDNRLRDIRLEGCTSLKSFKCDNNQLDKIDVSSFRNLVELHCGGNRLSELDVSLNSSLGSLRCGNNYITGINLLNNTALHDLQIQYNNITELNLSNNRGLGPDNVSTDQTTRVSKIVRQTNREYPFRLDFSGYVSGGNVGNIIASSIKAFNEDNAEIETVYSNGTAQFKAFPALVRYSYNTGLSGVTMDVAIETSAFLSLSLNGHVYRAFTDATSWENAREYCRKLSGDLAVLKTDEQKELIKELLSKAMFAGGNASRSYWLGAQRNASGSWSWIDGEALSLSEPLKFVTSRRSITVTIYGESVRTVTREFPEGIYLQMMESGDIIGWQDRHPGGFICEWQPVSADMAPYSEEYLRYISDDEAGGKFFGYIPSPIDYSNSTLPQAQYTYELPDEYNPRDYGITLHVGDQGNYGTCWSFASLGALEASYAAQGYGNEAPDLSELHQAWYAFRDPRPGYSLPLHSADQPILNQGGIVEDSIAFLSRMGTALNTEMPYSMAGGLEANPPTKLPDDYSNPIGLKAVYRFGSIPRDKTNRDRVKHLIMEYGAVRIGYLHLFAFEGADSSYYLPNLSTYYNRDIPANEGGWHAVILVGWNDHYSSSNFKSNPNVEGAWLALNSWGTSFGDGGYFWISYAQETQEDSGVFVAADDMVSKPYAHDTTAAIETVDYNWSANIFKAEGNESLNAVSFHTRSSKIRYEVYVNKFGTTEPEYGPGVPRSRPVASGTLDYAGYHTVDLDSPIELKPGEYFAVMVKLSSSSSNRDLTAAAKSNSLLSFKDFLNFNQEGSQGTDASVIQAGVSWFAYADNMPVSSDWKDGSRLMKLGNSYTSYTACIKAFSVENGPVNISMTELPSGALGQPYSCAINASGSRPIRWTVTGLPDGLSHNNGKITGTPTKAGTYNVSVSGTNSKGTDSKSLNLTIADNPGPNPEPDPEPKPGSGSSGGCNATSVIAGLAASLIFIIRKSKR